MPQIRKFVLATVLTLFILMAYLGSPMAARACTATPPGLPAPTLEDRVERADLVFTGTVLAVEGSLYDQRAAIQVHHYFKGGDGTPELQVGSWGDSAICRASVHPGEMWLFYVTEYPNGELHALWHTAGGAITEPHGELLAELTQITEGFSVVQPQIEEIGNSIDDDLADDPVVEEEHTEQEPTNPLPTTTEPTEQNRVILYVLVGAAVLACLILVAVLLLVGVAVSRRSAAKD